MVPHPGSSHLRGGVDPDTVPAVGLRIDIADEPRSLTQARAIFDEVWPSEGSQVTSNLLRALVHSGGYCSIVTDEDTDQVVGAALGFPARDALVPGGVYLHSHMAAVVEGMRDRGIGVAIKQHQRAWAMEQGIPVVSWTFDPLVRRNAHVNVNRLGVDIRDYYADFYGEMNDAINAGDRTDRLVAWWVVDSDRARDAALGGSGRTHHDVLAQESRDLIHMDEDGRPRLAAPPMAGETVLVSLPDDIVAVRRADPEIGLQWRLAVRDALTESFAMGLGVSAVTSTGAYLLAPTVST